MHGIKEISTSELIDTLAKGEQIRLVDVRSAEELQQGIIEGAEFIPMHLIPIKSNDFDEGEKIIFYCRSGARSGQVCAFLDERGMDNVYNLANGVLGWAQAGQEFVNPEPSMLTVA